jgi:outer membrane assembly lipoprotein YfiO
MPDPAGATGMLLTRRLHLPAFSCLLALEGVMTIYIPRIFRTLMALVAALIIGLATGDAVAAESAAPAAPVPAGAKTISVKTPIPIINLAALLGCRPGELADEMAAMGISTSDGKLDAAAVTKLCAKHGFVYVPPAPPPVVIRDKYQEGTGKVFSSEDSAIVAGRSSLKPDPLLTNTEYQEANILVQHQQYKKAANLYHELAKHTTAYTQKARLMQGEADCLFEIGKYADADDIYRDLLKNYGSFIDYHHVVGKLRDLAQKYKDGKVSWFGVSKIHKTIEIYKLITDLAPAEDLVTVDNLNLINIYMDEEEYDKAIAQQQHVLKRYPQTDQATYAAFLMAKAYYLMSLKFDQDADNALQAVILFKDFIATHPDHTLVNDANRLLAECQERLGRKLVDRARFYWTSRYWFKPIDARRYLYDAVRDYPKTGAEADARKLITVIEAAGYTTAEAGMKIRPPVEKKPGMTDKIFGKPYVPNPDKLPVKPVVRDQYSDDPQKRWLLPVGTTPGTEIEKPPHPPLPMTP